MKKKHVNIPVFIPHLGCPNNCVFCNQRSISGKISFEESSVEQNIIDSLSTVGDDCDSEIAFFGGSFTGIDRGLMMRLLETAYRFIQDGRVSSIRLSTRPDYIDEEILDILSRYGVKHIELGIQSMDDRVLAASARGHTAARTEDSCKLITERGFSLVGQMMIGLPLSTRESEIFTARRICEMGAEGARIYPAVVFRNTELEVMAEAGEYSPLTLDDAVSRTADALRVFVDHGVTVIRIGLHSGESLYTDDGISAGDYHPAMGELVENELYFRIISQRLELMKTDARGKTLIISVPKGSVSKAVGQHASNRKKLAALYGFNKITVTESDLLKNYNFTLDIL